MYQKASINLAHNVLVWARLTGPHAPALAPLGCGAWSAMSSNRSGFILVDLTTRQIQSLVLNGAAPLAADLCTPYAFRSPPRMLPLLWAKLRFKKALGGPVARPRWGATGTGLPTS